MSGAIPDEAVPSEKMLPAVWKGARERDRNSEIALATSGAITSYSRVKEQGSLFLPEDNRIKLAGIAARRISRDLKEKERE